MSFGTVVEVVVVVGALGGLAYWKVPSFRQLLRINGDKAIKSASTPLERVTDNVNQAIAKLPAQRALVAQQMTAAQNAQKKADDKRTEVEGLFKEVQTAMSANATAGTISTLKQRWLDAKNSIAGLDTAAAETHQSAEEAQADLEGLLKQIQQSKDGVEKLKNDANLAAILRQSTAFRTQVNDLKEGLGANADDVRAIEDGLANARNEAELSRGSAADREMAKIKERAQATSADDAFAAELAARSAAGK